MGATQIFAPALTAMPQQEWSRFGPQSFQGYLTEHNLHKHDTAQAISVDHCERLNPALRQAETMVLRLGKGEDGNTQFALIGTPGRLADYFLHDAPAAVRPTRRIHNGSPT